MAAVSIQSVPINLRVQFGVYDDNFVPLAVTGGVGAALGSNVNGTFTVTTPGRYRVRVYAFSFTPGSQAGAPPTMIPESFMRPYTLSVTQP